MFLNRKKVESDLWPLMNIFPIDILKKKNIKL